MKLLKYILFFLLISSAYNFAGEPDSVYNGKKLYMMEMKGWTIYKGADKKFVADELKPSHVNKYLQSESNIWWLEKEFYIPLDKILKGDIWLSVWSNFGAFEAYINNQLIIKCGVVGDAKTEKVGRMLTSGIIPPTILKSGMLAKSLQHHEESGGNGKSKPYKNVLKIKLSNYFNPDHAKFSKINLSPYKEIQSELDNGVYMPLFLAGFLVLAMVINVAFYFALNKRIVFLLLAALFLCYVIAMTRYFIIYGYNPSVIYNNLLYYMYVYSLFVGKLLLIVVLLFEFEIIKKYQKIIFLSSLVLMIVLFNLNNFSVAYYFVSPTIPFLLSVWALYKKKPGSITITLGLLALLVFTYLNYDKTMTYGLTVGIMVFAVAMIFSVSKKIFDQSKAYQQSLLKSSILENQLLQKHIQPHFLMNSLMSLQELIDVDQERAGEMIELLSKEFHLLATFSKQKLISLEDELEICKIHLTIMGYQQRAKFELKTNGINGDEEIPPAVIHTLVENGLTHGYAGKENGYFQLDKTVENHTIKYRLFNDGKTQGTTNKKNTGLGLKYVEARLEESYPGKWNLTSQPVNNGWEAIIEIGTVL